MTTDSTYLSLSKTYRFYIRFFPTFGLLLFSFPGASYSEGGTIFNVLGCSPAQCCWRIKGILSSFFYTALFSVYNVRNKNSSNRYVHGDLTTKQWADNGRFPPCSHTSVFHCMEDWPNIRSDILSKIHDNINNID